MTLFNGAIDWKNINCTAIESFFQELALTSMRWGNTVKLVEIISEGAFMAMVLCMSSSFWLLRVESRDFSNAEKEKTACKAEQIHKMTTILTQNGPRLFFD